MHDEVTKSPRWFIADFNEGLGSLNRTLSDIITVLSSLGESSQLSPATWKTIAELKARRRGATEAGGSDHDSRARYPSFTGKPAPAALKCRDFSLLHCGSILPITMEIGGTLGQANGKLELLWLFCLWLRASFVAGG